MMLEDLDLQRETNDNPITDIFTRTVYTLSKYCMGMSTRGIARWLKINPQTLLTWGDQGLIFPKLKGRSKYRYYQLKDILRAMTLKYLMSDLGFRRYPGVKLFLELVNEKLKQENLNQETIDNIAIDEYLIRVLNYDAESIAQMALGSNSRRGKK